MTTFPVWPFVRFNLIMFLFASCIWWLVSPALSIGETAFQCGFFVALTALILVAGHRTVNDQNPNLFTGLILGSVLGKLVLSLIFLLIYTKTMHPQGRSFLVLFFGLYLGYTIYEIREMIRLSRQQALHP